MIKLQAKKPKNWERESFCRQNSQKLEEKTGHRVPLVSEPVEEQGGIEMSGK